MSGALRTGKPDDVLMTALASADQRARALGDALFGFGEDRTTRVSNELLKQASHASADDVVALASVAAPPLGSSIGTAWQWIQKLTIAFPGWSIGEPAVEENRAIWLRDLLRELARFELPPDREEALVWLSIHCGALAEEEDSEFAALMAELLGGASYRLGATGCDHVGRLIASEISRGDRLSENLFDTLRLVGLGRHIAVIESRRLVPSPHVARGLAGCGRSDAGEVLCETITLDRGDASAAVSAAVQAASAATEVMSVYPDLLPSVLETIAMELAKEALDRESLAKQLAPVIALPPPILADSGSDSILRTCASLLRDPKSRAQLFASNEESELFLACWAEAAMDVGAFVPRLLERYRQACDDEREDVKTLLRAVARIREGESLVMRPMWLCVLAEALGDFPEHTNASLVAEVLSFGVSSGLTLDSDIPLPADAGLDMLVELERRLRDETLMASLLKASPNKSANEIRNTLIRLIRLNLAGRPGDVMFPFAQRMDCNSISVFVDADFSKSDAATRAALIEHSSIHYPHGPTIMVRAVAAAESVDELLAWLLGRSRQYSFDGLFAIACALRGDRIELWRKLLLASQKDKRQLGLQMVLSTLKVVDPTQKYNEHKILVALPQGTNVDADAIRREVSSVLDEYEAAQAKRKNGDDLKDRLYLNSRELSRTSDEVDSEAAKRRAALTRLCERVANITGIEPSRFALTPPTPPQDRGSCYADVCGEATHKLIEAAAGFLVELNALSMDYEERNARVKEWFTNLAPELREKDGTERLRLHDWFAGTGYWRSFDEKVLGRAQSMLSDEQSRRLSELRPPVLSIRGIAVVGRTVSSLPWSASYHYEEILVVKLDWYESVLANLPESIQQLGPLSEHSVTPHPPHDQAIASVYANAMHWLGSRDVELERKQGVYKRLWPLLWWAASFGGRIDAIDAAAIGSSISCGQASLGDLVWYLVQPSYSQTAENLIRAIEYPDRICIDSNSELEKDVRAVVEAVASVCREQEQGVDSSLPSTLATTWRKLPAPKDQSGLRDILAKYSHVAYQSVGRTDDWQKAFADRIRECLDQAEESWTTSDDYFAPKYIKFDMLDAWIASTTKELRALLEEGVVSEDNLLRITLDRPLLMRSVLEATGRSDQMEAGIWIAFHSASNLEDIAITLDSSTGHPGFRRPELSMQQIEQRLLDHYASEIGKREGMFLAPPVTDATIRHRWKQSAIDVHPPEKLEPLFKTFKYVLSPTNRLRVEGLLDAMNGTLNMPAKRKQLEASLKDRPNLALLQLAALPLPEDRDALASEISRRLKSFEAMSVAGRKRKSTEARDNMRRGLDQARRTLADNAGLADPTQLDWISGEAIASELAEFERVESGEYVVQLRLRGDGPHLLVTKGGKPLKSIPAALKSSDKGKRLTELQGRLKTALRDARAVLEASMVRQHAYSANDLRMMMRHPVVASVAREMVFIVKPNEADGRATVGLPGEEGECLVELDGTKTKVAGAVYLAHPLELDRLGVLADWKSWSTDHPPQPFQQVERAIVRASELETAGEGKRIVRHVGVALASRDQAFRILQAHGWQDDHDASALCRKFARGPEGDITAVLDEFTLYGDSIGILEFRDASWNEMGIVDVPPIILSEAVRDIDRTVAGASG